MFKDFSKFHSDIGERANVIRDAMGLQTAIDEINRVNSEMAVEIQTAIDEITERYQERIESARTNYTATVRIFRGMGE